MKLLDIVMLIKSVYYEDEDDKDEIKESEIYLKESILTKKEQENIKIFLKSNQNTLKPVIDKIRKFLNSDIESEEKDKSLK